MTTEDDDVVGLSPEAAAALAEFLGNAELQQAVAAEVNAFREECARGEQLTAQMATTRYWEARYKEEASSDFEWLAGWDRLAPLCAEWLGPARDGKLLVVGCGSSPLTANLVQDGGWRSVTATDVSETVIAAMARKHRGLGVDWRVDDVRKMAFPDCSFDAVLDKATLDALLADRTLQDDDGVCPDVAATLCEVARVLKPGGRFVWVSFGRPKSALLRRPPWGDVLKLAERRTIGDPGCISFEAYLLVKQL